MWTSSDARSPMQWQPTSFRELCVEHELHHPVAIADDLAPDVVAEEGASHDDVEPSARSLLLAEPDAAHLGDREDPIRKEPGDLALVREPERVAHGDARLFHRHARERREADHVARRVHARDGGSVVVVHDDVATGVDLDAGLLETQALGVTVPARGDQRRVHHQRLAGRERAHETFGPAFDTLVAPLEVKRDPEPLHRRGQSLAHLPVQERQESWPPVDEVHLDAERGERARVLASDHAAPDDHERVREALDAQDPVRIVHVRVLVRDAGRPVRRGTGGDQDDVAPEALEPFGRDDLDRVRIREASFPVDQLDPMPLQVPQDPFDLEIANGVLALEQPGHREVRIDVDLDPVEGALPVAGQEQGGLAQGLGRQRAGVNGGASRGRLPFHDRDPLAEVGGLSGSPLARGTSAEHHQVVMASHGAERSWPGRSFRPVGCPASDGFTHARDVARVDFAP